MTARDTNADSQRNQCLVGLVRIGGGAHDHEQEEGEDDFDEECNTRGDISAHLVGCEAVRYRNAVDSPRGWC